MPAGALTTVQNEKLAPFLAAIEAAIPKDPDRVMAVAAGCPIMICRGADGCIYNATCPFVSGALISQRPPEGEHCPVEIAYFFEFYKGYRNEINPEGTNFSTMSLIKEMCVLELQLMRAERLLSIDGAIVEVVAIGVDKVSGSIIDKPEMSAKAHTWRLLLKEKIRLFEQMGLTPKARAAIGSSVSKDPSTFAAELISHAEKIFKDREMKRRQAVMDEKQANGGMLPRAQQRAHSEDFYVGTDNTFDVEVVAQTRPAPAEEVVDVEPETTVEPDPVPIIPEPEPIEQEEPAPRHFGSAAPF